MNISQNRLLVSAFLIVVVFALFSGSLSNEFVWDDKQLLDRREFAGWDGLLKIFTIPDSVDPYSGSIYYRPVTYLTFLLDYQAWRLDPFWYHLENVALHAVTVLLFYLLAARAFGDPTAALFSALIFAVHPLVSESVSFVSARNNIICAAMMLASLLLLERSRRGPWWWAALSVAAYLLALLSKEPGAALPIFLLVIFVLPGRRDFGVRPLALVAFFGATAVYFFMRMRVLGVMTSETGMDLSYSGLRLVVSCLFEYFRLMLLPLGLSADYLTEPVSMVSFKAGAAFAGAALLAYGAIGRKVPAALRASSAWLMASFLPISNIVPIPSAAVADRFLYIPLLGMCLAAGHALSILARRRQVLGIAAALVLVLALSGATLSRNRVWKDDLVLWQDTVKKSPSKIRAHNNLGNAYSRAGDYDRAVWHFKEALALGVSTSTKPPSAYLSEVHYNLALVLADKGLAGEAIEHYGSSIKLNPGNVDAYNNRGIVYYSEGRIDRAIDDYKTALLLRPEYQNAYFNLGEAYLAAGEPLKAIEHLKTFLRMRPGYAEAHRYLAEAYIDAGYPLKAREHMEMERAVKEAEAQTVPAPAR